jgi:hypothetical protein
MLKRKGDRTSGKQKIEHGLGKERYKACPYQEKT